MSDPLNGKKWPVALGVGVCATVAVWFWGWNVTPLQYGEMNFVPAQAKAGEEIKLCFTGVRWLRLGPTKLNWNVTCWLEGMGKTRLDFPAYEVAVPPNAGPVPRKCRDFTVPKACKPGMLEWNAVARTTLFPFGEWNPRYTPVPYTRLEVVP